METWFITRGPNFEDGAKESCFENFVIFAEKCP